MVGDSCARLLHLATCSLACIMCPHALHDTRQFRGHGLKSGPPAISSTRTTGISVGLAETLWRYTTYVRIQSAKRVGKLFVDSAQKLSEIFNQLWNLFGFIWALPIDA
jgi:hypothetical protein